MTEEQVKHMVNRFLAWRLPENFNPDNGISFKKTFNDHLPLPTKHDPVGTNLLDATQATEMVHHLVYGMPGPKEAHINDSCDEITKLKEELDTAKRISHVVGGMAAIWRGERDALQIKLDGIIRQCAKIAKNHKPPAITVKNLPLLPEVKMSIVDEQSGERIAAKIISDKILKLLDV